VRSPASRPSRRRMRLVRGGRSATAHDPPRSGRATAVDSTRAAMRRVRRTAENTRGGPGTGPGFPPRGAGPNWGSGPDDEGSRSDRRRPRPPVLEKNSGRSTNPIAGARRRRPRMGHHVPPLPAHGAPVPSRRPSPGARSPAA